MRKKLMELVCESVYTDNCIAHCNHPHCGIVQTIAQNLIANGVTFATDNSVGDKVTPSAGWIPVTERLPEKWQNVLTVSKNGSIDFDYICSSGGWYGDLENQQNPVTHWMPLPEPPKEGE